VWVREKKKMCRHPLKRLLLGGYNIRKKVNKQIGIKEYYSKIIKLSKKKHMYTKIIRVFVKYNEELEVDNE